MFLRLISTRFILRLFSLVIHSAILRIYFWDLLINLMSKLLANLLNFISILSFFYFFCFFNLFIFSILGPYFSLFVIYFINSLLISYPFVLFTYFSFSVPVFKSSLFSLSCSSKPFITFFFSLLLSLLFLLFFLFLQMS